MDMLDEIRAFPDQFKFARENYLRKINALNVANIHLAGMGGSALPADLMNDYLSQVNPSKQIRVTRDYDLPADVSSNDLVICSSYSGNTEETLEAFEQALAKKARLLVLTHGGQLKERAVKNKLPLIEIPASIQPRCAVGYFFSAMLFTLEAAGWIKQAESEIKALEAFMRLTSGQCEAEGMKLAAFLKDRLPIIYGPTQLAGILRIFKIKLNENSKIQAFYNVYPELNHNEMVGYTRLVTEPAVVHFKSRFMHPRIGLRMDVMKKVLGDKLSFYDVTLEGKDLLQEMFHAHAIADHASYCLAKEYGMDPAPVVLVETFKKLL